MASKYSEKLKDPRWQKKRLEILERDKWTCRICEDTTSTLVVHHRDYLPGKEPWEYPDDLLITLCEDCHIEEMGREELEQSLIHNIRRKFFINELSVLDDAFSKMPDNLTNSSESFMVAEAIWWFLTDSDVLKEMTDRCWENMHKERK